MTGRDGKWDDDGPIYDPHILDTENGQEAQRRAAVRHGCSEHGASCPLLALPEPTGWEKFKAAWL